MPEGHFFMMGDNRDNSTDSRFLSEVGFVPFENLVGQAPDHLLLASTTMRASGRSGNGRPTSAGRASCKWCIEPCPIRAKRRSQHLSARLGLRFHGPRAARACPDACERARPRSSPNEDNERLEFLGDRVLGLAVAELLADDLPRGARGGACPPVQSSRARRDLRRGRARMGARRLHPDERRRGRQRRPRARRPSSPMPARRCSAPCSPMAATRPPSDVVRRFWEPPARAGSSSPRLTRNPSLQEWAQGRALAVAALSRNGPRRPGSRAALHRRGADRRRGAGARPGRQQARGRAGCGARHAAARGRLAGAAQDG